MHDFDQFFALNASASDEGKGFGKGIHLQSEDEVHGQLDGLPGAVRAEVKQLFAHDVEDRLGFPERFGIAANHEDKFAFLGAPITAGDRRVEKANAALGARCSDFAGKRGRNSTRIDVNAATLETLHRATGTPQNFFDGGGIADHGEKKIGSRGDFLGRFGEPCVSGDEFVGARSRAVPDSERVAGLDEIHAHGPAHKAEPD